MHLYIMVVFHTEFFCIRYTKNTSRTETLHTESNAY